MRRLVTLFLVLVLFCSLSGMVSAGDGLFPVEDRNKKWGYIDGSGKVVIDRQYDSAREFSEGLAAVRKGDLWGYIDRTGKVVINFTFQNAGKFSEGLAVAGRKERMYTGYIDKTGRYAIEPKYESCLDFSEGLAAVREYTGLKVQNGNSDAVQERAGLC